jgi:hypothetical protein
MEMVAAARCQLFLLHVLEGRICHPDLFTTLVDYFVALKMGMEPSTRKRKNDGW